MANKKFGEKLRKFRNSQGYTQQQVSDILELKNKSTLGSWEVGKSEPDAYTLLKLCRLYEVQDIYKAFDEDYDKESLSNSDSEIIHKFQQLNDEYKKLIETQINQLLEIQNKTNNINNKTDY